LCLVGLRGGDVSHRAPSSGAFPIGAGVVRQKLQSLVEAAERFGVEAERARL
jgi:hypothetical protein